MKSKIFAALVVLGTLTAYGQTKPAPPPAQAVPQKVDPAKPAEETATVSPETVKSLKDALNMFQLDQLAVQTAQNTFSQTDPVSKKAMTILQEQMANSPDIKKANDQMEADRKALLAQIDALRSVQHLDKTWDWDFNRGMFVKTATQVPAPK